LKRYMSWIRCSGFSSIKYRQYEVYGCMSIGFLFYHDLESCSDL
jgi:hypothetical protein